MSRLTQVPTRLSSVFRVQGYHLLWLRFPPHSAILPLCTRCRSFNPGVALQRHRFGLLRVRSPLLAQSRLFSFPPGNEMFQFPGFASHLVG